MATKKSTKSTVVVLAKALIAGTDKHLASVGQLMLMGSSYTPAQITAALGRIVSLRADVDAAKAAAKAKLVAETDGTAAPRELMKALVSYVRTAYGNQPDILADFGIYPKARAVPTAEAKTAAAVKRAATRKARNTMGPVAKKGIKGAVTGITVTPVEAATPVAAAATPAIPATPASPSAGAPSPAATATPAPRTTP